MTTVQGMLQGPYHFSTMVEVNGQTFVQLHKMPLKWPLIQSGFNLVISMCSFQTNSKVYNH